jgi:hypothetical protein
MAKFITDAMDMDSPYATLVDFIQVDGKTDDRPWVQINLKDGWGRYISGGFIEGEGWQTTRVDAEFTIQIAKEKVLEEDLWMVEDV